MAKRQVENVKETGQQLGAAQKTVVIEQPRRLSVALEVTGTAPLIQNKFSQKAIEQMLRKHMGISVQREAKKPRELIEDATIRNRDGKVIIPPEAFKKGMLTAASALKSLKKTQLRIQLYIEGNGIPITYEGEMVPRMDMVRTSGMTRTPDVRFRPSFENWKARIIIQFDDVLSVQTVVDLLNRAGNVGVGEWRPERDGTFGTFRVTRHISDPKEIAEVREQCAVPRVTTKAPDWALDADLEPEELAALLNKAGMEAPDEDDDEKPTPRKKAGGSK